MDKPYDLLLQGDHDNATALDDLLLDPERPPDSTWVFKSDVWIPGEAHLEEAMEEEKLSTANSLDVVSYMQVIATTKKEATFLHSASSDCSTFVTAHLPLKDASDDTSQRHLSFSRHTPLENFMYGPEEPNMFSNGGSTVNSTESFHNCQFDQCSEKGNSMDNIKGRAEEKLRAMQNNLMIDSPSTQYYSVQTDQLRKEVQKPPTTAGICLEDLKAVFHLERPHAERRLRLKRTTFSNLSRHYGISKWPFRTIRDAKNRMMANEILLSNRSVSKDRCRKIKEQQRLLNGVITLIYADPRESRDSNTLAVLLRIVEARESLPKCSKL